MFKRLNNQLLFFILVFTNVEIFAQIAMPDNVCIGELKHYNVDPNSIAGSTYTWKLDGVIQLNSTTNEIDLTWNNSGVYLLEVQELSAGGCLGPVRSGQIFVNLKPIITANSNSPVCENSTINLIVQTDQVGDYLWKGGNGYLSTISNPAIPNASPTDAGVYIVTVSINGCTSEPSIVNVVVEKCDKDFFIPEGFSPNGDGTNDLFVIRGIEYYPDNTFVIFNRWGDKLFETNHYKNTWSGKSTMGLRLGGDDLPTGTYFYVLDLGNGSAVYKGTIYLNR
jgi:gliding motility-associated-like protein